MLTDPTAARIAAFERDEAEGSDGVVKRSDASQPDNVRRLQALQLRSGAPAAVHVVTTASDAADWDAYIERRPDATAYHLRAWKVVAERAYRMRAPFLLARDERSGAVRGALPLFVVDRPFGRYVTSGLFGAYGPLLSNDEAAARSLLLSAQRLTDRVHAGLLHLKVLGTQSLPVAFDQQQIWVTARLPLSRDAREVWQGLSRNMRNLVRKARSSGLRLRTGPGELDHFYDVLAENMHRKGSPIYGARFMAELVGALGDKAEIITLSLGEERVSAALAVYFNGVCYVPFASSRARHLPKRPNHLLYWEMIERACAQGLDVLDFGSSMIGQSTLDFKKHWRPRLEPIVSHLYSRRPSPPVIVPTGPGVQWVMRAWRLLPRPLADALGPRVMRWTA